ncbi:MAG: SUMF1/EgtB/PvdO family nonheme iron enzyme [Deltaproteobacteria bacterium]|nr:SUMF1/EgtB/PvdO family nonheme iron enzyme [Nannocystaceae bacterium]
MHDPASAMGPPQQRFSVPAASRTSSRRASVRALVPLVVIQIACKPEQILEADAGTSPAPSGSAGSNDLAAPHSQPLVSATVVPGGEPPDPTAPTDPCPADMIFVPGGKFSEQQRGFFRRLNSDFNERTFGVDGIHMVEVESVSDFCLDRTEFTVGRWKRCLDEGVCAAPQGQGERINMDDLAASDHYPMFFRDRVTTYEVCQVLGGRLPSLAEWMWVYWGGDEHRQFPWGSEEPSAALVNICDTRCQIRSYESDRDADDPPCTIDMQRCKGVDGVYVDRSFGTDAWESLAPVGSFPAGAGRWGHLDLEGNANEIVVTLPTPDSLIDAILRSMAQLGRAPAMELAFFGSCGSADAGDSPGGRPNQFLDDFPPCLHSDGHGLKQPRSAGFRCARVPEHHSSGDARAGTAAANLKQP